MTDAKPRRGQPEAIIQRAIIDRLRWHGCLVMAVPNEGRRSLANGRRMKANGLTAGAPDLLVYRAGRHALLEVKAGKGRVSDAQSEMHARLAAQGWPVHVVRSQDEAMDALRSEGWQFP